MKILHINSELSWRGGEQQLAYLLEGLMKDESIEVYVMGREEAKMQHWCTENGIRYITCPLRGSADVKSAYHIAQLCRELRIDIMHAHTSHAHASALYSKVLFLNKAKLAIHRRVSFPVKNNIVSKFKYRSNLVDHIFCISKDVQRVLFQSIGKLNNTSVVYDAIDPSRFEKKEKYKDSFHLRYGLDTNSFIVVNIAALSPEKDQQTLVDAAAKLVSSKSNKVYFLIAGEGNMREELQASIDEKKLGSSVHLLGFVSDVGDLLQHADAFLLSSKQEGLGTSILDAFCYRLPVVATDAGGIHELVEHGKTGFLCPVGDGDAICDSLSEVHRNPEVAARMGEEGYNRVKESYLVDAMTAATIQIYRKIV